MNFWTVLKKIIKDCWTENNSTSYCPFRVLGCIFTCISIPVFFGCEIYNVIRTDHFDCVNFATAFATIMGGIALLTTAVAIKAVTDTP